MTMHTGYPKVDARFPHFAPMLGSLPLINEPERTLEQALADAESPHAPSLSIRPDPWPEVAVGLATAAVSGAVTGGVAAGSWGGAGIGAGLCSSAWSGFTLFSSYRELGPKSRAVLGVSAVVGLGTVVYGIWSRSRRAR